MTIEQSTLDSFLAPVELPLPDAAAPAVDVPVVEEVAADEPVQVAGIGSVVANIAAKAAKGVATKAKANADAAAKAAAMPEAAKMITPAVAQDIPLRAQAAAATQPPLAKPSVDLMNYLRTGLPDDANRFLDETAKAAGVVTPTRVSYKDEIAKLQGMGFKSKDIEWIAGYADNTQQMTKVAQAREVMVAATKNAHDLATRVVQNPGDAALAAEYHQATQFLGIVTRGVKNIQTDYARALGVMRMTPGGDPAALADLIYNVGGIENIVAHAQKLAKIDITNPANVAKAAKLSEAGMWTKTKDAWTTTWINGLLSSPVTHAKNVVGNALFAGLQIPERAGAALIGQGDNLIRYWKGLDPRQVVEAEEVMALIHGSIGGAIDGLATGARAFKENRPQFGTDVKVEAMPSALSGDAFGLSGNLAKAMDLYGNAVTLPGRALMAEDELFKVLNYSMELHAQASRASSQAYRAAIDQGMSHVDAEKAATATRLQIMDTPPAEIDAAAMNAARVNTFTAPLETGSFGARVQSLANDNLLVKMHLPFIRTPLNLFDQTLQRTPFAPISKQWRDDVAAGGITKDLALAKMGMGTTALTVFGALAANGMITGGGPGSGGMDENLKRSGWRPYSFVLPKPGEKDITRLQKSFGRDAVVVGNDKVYVSYQGIEPFGAMLSVASDFAEYSRWQDDVGLVEEVAMGAALGMMRYTSQLPYLQAVGEFAELMQRGGDGPTMAKNMLDLVGRQAGGFLIGGSPAGVASSLQAGIERINDPVLSMTREPKSTDPFIKGFYEAFNQYRSRVPGLSEQLPPKLDRWARPMKSGEGNWWELVSPVKISEANQTEADKVLMENHVGWKMPGKNLAWQGGGKTPYSGLNIELSHEQYNELLTIYANEIRHAGKDVQTALVDAARDPAFKRLSLGDRQKYLANVSNEYMEAARKTLFERHFDTLMPEYERKRNVVDAYGYTSDELKR